MSERRFRKRIIEKGLATNRVTSDSEAVLVPLVLPGLSSGHKIQTIVTLLPN